MTATADKPPGAPEHPPPWRWVLEGDDGDTADVVLLDGNGETILRVEAEAPFVPRELIALAPELEAALEDLSLAVAKYILATDGAPGPREAHQTVAGSIQRARALVDRLKAARITKLPGGQTP